MTAVYQYNFSTVAWRFCLRKLVFLMSVLACTPGHSALYCINSITGTARYAVYDERTPTDEANYVTVPIHTRTSAENCSETGDTTSTVYDQLITSIGPWGGENGFRPEGYSTKNATLFIDGGITVDSGTIVTGVGFTSNGMSGGESSPSRYAATWKLTSPSAPSSEEYEEGAAAYSHKTATGALWYRAPKYITTSATFPEVPIRVSIDFSPRFRYAGPAHNVMVSHGKIDMLLTYSLIRPDVTISFDKNNLFCSGSTDCTVSNILRIDSGDDNTIGLLQLTANSDSRVHTAIKYPDGGDATEPTWVETDGYPKTIPLNYTITGGVGSHQVVVQAVYTIY